MGTLLLRLAAPLQSWGAESKFDIRRTEKEPTKSGVVGLLAAALGRRRDDSIDDLCRLRFGVRVDREGELLNDFHMVKGEKTSYVTHRYYLSDAVFLAGLESEDDTFLGTLEEALHHPEYPLFLGRRSCPPTMPLSLGIRDRILEEALKDEPWQISEWQQRKNSWRNQPENVSLRMILDCDGQKKVSIVKRDLPFSFNPSHRQYEYRAVSEEYVVKMVAASSMQHDPMKELGD